MPAQTAITPLDILNGLTENMIANAKPVRPRIYYMPTCFVIRYPEAERDDIDDVRDIILREAGSVLSETLSALNHGGLFARLLPFRRKRYVTASQEWRIDLLAAPDDMVEPGTIRIQSRMTANTGTTFDGTETVIATRKVPTAANKVSS